MSDPLNEDVDMFVWKKKLQSEGKGKMSKRELDKMQVLLLWLLWSMLSFYYCRAKEKLLKNQEEMEAIQRNRIMRQSLREDAEMMARDEERKQHSEWRRVEDKFHLSQALLRSKLRIKERRPMPIDLLGRYACYGDPAPVDDAKGSQPAASTLASPADACPEWDDFDLEQPSVYLKGLTRDEMEDLLADIRVCCRRSEKAAFISSIFKVFRLIDKNKHGEFWDDIATLVQADLDKMSRNGIDEEIPSSVAPFVLKLFEVCEGNYI